MLLDYMIKERNSALVAARRSLSNLAEFSRDFEPYALAVNRLHEDAFFDEVITLIDRHERRATRWLPGKNRVTTL
jgi:hypothetical protein